MVLTLSEAEHEQWKAEAAHRGMTVAEFARHVVSWSFAARVEGQGTAATTAGRRLVTEAFSCAWCGRGLHHATVRKMYCSGRCRIAAYRDRKRNAA